MTAPAGANQGCCYVYGIPNYHSRHKTHDALPKFMEKNRQRPTKTSPTCSFFMARWICQGVKPPYIEAELTPAMLPSGFCYYAAGHVHERFSCNFKDGILVYSGCTETVGYDEAKNPKGFYYVQVDESGEINPEQIELASPRRFIIFEK